MLGQVENCLWSTDLVLNAAQHERPVTVYNLSRHFHLDGSEMSPREEHRCKKKKKRWTNSIWLLQPLTQSRR